MNWFGTFMNQSRSRSTELLVRTLRRLQPAAALAWVTAGWHDFGSASAPPHFRSAEGVQLEVLQALDEAAQVMRRGKFREMLNAHHDQSESY